MNNNKSQNFIHGLRPFSSSIPKSLKKYLKKGGYNYSNIVNNWSKMITKEIASSCYPISIKMGKQMKNGTLILNVFHGKELEIEYKKSEIIDKINSFFGYNCINQITLKIVQKKIQPKRNQFSKIKDFSKIYNKVNKVKDEQLKGSLNNLINAFNEKNE
jgi:hypothetical protein